MFLFKSDPNQPAGFKSIIVRVALALLAFWVILAYLVPMIQIEPLETVVRVVVVLLGIFFLVDMFL
jgi:hypothetical protein